MSVCRYCGALLLASGPCPRCGKTPPARPPPLPTQGNIPSFGQLVGTAQVPPGLPAKSGPRPGDAPPRIAPLQVPVRQPPAAAAKDNLAGARGLAQPVPVSEPRTGRTATVRPAPLWRRFLAWMLDAVAIAAVVCAYLWIASKVVNIKAVPAGTVGMDRWVAEIRAWRSVLVPGVLLTLLLALSYGAAFAVLKQSCTPGRSLMGLFLIDSQGRPPAPARAIIRGVLSLISFGFFLGGVWLALFHRRHQTLHDWLTQTYVVRRT